jgi:hypothetical protein
MTLEEPAEGTGERLKERAERVRRVSPFVRFAPLKPGIFSVLKPFPGSPQPGALRSVPPYHREIGCDIDER